MRDPVTVRDRSKVVVPPCPACWAPLHVDWVDVRSLGDPRSEWIPGRLTCTVNEDHDTTLLNVGTWAEERT